MRRNILIFLIFITTSTFAQTQLDLLVLQRAGKLNLVPRYGYGMIEKTAKEKAIDKKFIDNALSLSGSREAASKEYSDLGYKYFYQGYVGTAMKRFNQAWLMDSTNALVYFGYSSVLQIIKDNPAIYFDTKLAKIKEVEDPEKYYDIGLQKDTGNENEKFALQILSVAYSTYEKYDLAIQSCDKLLEFDANDTATFYTRGHLYVLTGEWNKAIDDLNRAFPNGINSSIALNDLGWTYEQLGDYAKALTYYDKASLITPQYLNPIYTSAVLRLKIGEFQSALEYVDRCIAIKDDVGQFYKTKGEILLKLNRKDEAVKNLKKAKKLGDLDAKKILKET